MARPTKPKTIKVLRADFARGLELIGAKATVAYKRGNEIIDAGNELILISRSSKRVIKVPKSTVAAYELDFEEFMAEWEPKTE